MCRSLRKGFLWLEALGGEIEMEKTMMMSGAEYFCWLPLSTRYEGLVCMESIGVRKKPFDFFFAQKR